MRLLIVINLFGHTYDLELRRDGDSQSTTGPALQANGNAETQVADNLNAVAGFADTFGFTAEHLHAVS